MKDDFEVVSLEEVAELEHDIIALEHSKKAGSEKEKKTKKAQLKKKKKIIKIIKEEHRKKVAIALGILAFILIALESYIISSYKWSIGNDIPWMSKPITLPSVKIIDENSDTRPIAVMINNHNKARPNHAGLQDAYIIYEIIVEGGITRYMAIFKDANTERIGSVRSSRHYFLDYALENDAIYTHFGWSPQAKSDITTLKINNVNGLYDAGFWRDKTLNVPTEHTAFTSIKNINETAKKRGYRTTSNQDTLLNYTFRVQNLNTLEIEGTEAMIANKVSIRYSNYVTTSYVYDSEAKVYKRFVNNVEHTDGITKEQYTFKNIITYQVANSSIDSYGRQNIDNIGSGTGYYITNGYAIPITWEKESRSSQTVYKYTDGRELLVNDGNTFIQIQPKGQKLSITE